MPSTSSIPAFLDALKVLLDARPGLQGPPAVTVATGDLAAETPREAIILAAARGPRATAGLRNPAAGGVPRNQDTVVFGAIWIVKPGQGETVIKAARDRAYALLGEVEQTLLANPQVGGSCMWAFIGTDSIDQGVNDQGRWAQVDFEITYRARLV
ncbi:MAG TPA: hypothetical protein VJ966_03545 [Actinomycetes bacterium]|nr:hypothetical protein [Actinomycetes bacterium]